MALCPGPAGLHWQQLNQIQSCPLTDLLYLYQAQNTEVQMTDLTEVLTESAETEMPSDGMNQLYFYI